MDYKVKNFIKKINIPKKFWWGAFLGYLLSFSLKSFGIVLILPLIKGLIEKDYSFIFNIFFFNKISEIFPNVVHISNEHLFIIFAFLIVSFIAASMVINYFLAIYTWSQRQKFAMKTNALLLEHYLLLDNSFFSKNKMSELRVKLNQVVENVNNFINYSSNLINYSFELLSISIILFIISKYFFIYALIFSIFYFFCFYFIKNNIRKKTILAQEANIKYNSALQDILQRYSLIQIFDTQEKEKEKFTQVCNDSVLSKGKIEKISKFIDPFAVLFEVIILFIMGFIIGYSILSHVNVGLTSAIVFIGLFQKQLRCIKDFSQNYLNRSVTQDILSENFKQIDFNSETENKKILFKKIKKSIEIRNLNFKYDNQIVFKKFNAEILAGEKTWIIGPNGSGKSTLVNLIMRLKKTPPNSIFIDGVDILKFDVSSLRKKISYVSQDVKFFYGTVRENVSYRGTYSDQEILTVLEKLKIRDFIDKLPEGLNTIVGDDGLRFSGGQRQRFAIAQAILNNSDIIIFDEATKNIDSDTEKIIMDMLEKEFKNKTRIIINHNEEHLAHTDSIIRLK